MKRSHRILTISAISSAAVALLMVALSLPMQAAPARYDFSVGETLTPLGAGQPDHAGRHQAYKTLWQALYGNNHPNLAWTAVTATVDGTDHAPGAVLGDLDGAFAQEMLGDVTTISRSFALHPRDVALFYPTVRDEYGQTAVWEEGDFEQLFRVYLWCEETDEGCAYFDTLSETQVASDLADYDVLILPTIRIGYVDEVVDALGADGLDAIRDFVESGGFLYAQSNASYLPEAAGLVPSGTVDLDTRITDADNVGLLNVLQPDHPLAFSWLSDTAYVLNEPCINATAGMNVIATFDDTTEPGSVAIGVSSPGDGRVVLFNGHPSNDIDYYPQLFDALLWATGERANVHGALCQQYTTTVNCRTIPAYEPGIPIVITTTFNNFWDGPLDDVVITETLHDGFTTTQASITPTPTTFMTHADGTTTIAWAITETLPGATVFTYTAYTEAPSGTTGSLVSTAEADFVDPFRPTENHPDGLPRHIERNSLSVKTKMAARLVGDRDIELDGLYPLPSDGEYFDIALTLENKEETKAERIVITDVVALLSPIVNVDDQRVVPQVVTDTWGVSEADSLSNTLFAMNEVFFYETPVDIYPMPRHIDGVTESTAITTGTFYTLTTWERGPRLVYTYTGNFTTTPGLSTSLTIPDAYSDVITLTAQGDILLPALRMVWDYGTLPAYDYQEPAVRYGLFSHELLSRTVSFESDPVTETPGSLVLEGGGGSVYTNLGGHPIPYHEYLSSGVVHIPIPPVTPTVSYRDIWARPQTMDLRTVFYDIVPFPPPEYHAVVNTTFEMQADRDGDGRGDTRVLEFPSREGADLTLYLKSWSNFHPDLAPLRHDETLISQGMFKGLGFSLEPAHDTWTDSWASLHLQGYTTDTVLTDVVSVPAYDYLYFQQYLQSQAREGIIISGTLDVPHGHREGVMKIDDGARFVYHQKAVGPSRYEVFDAHVQAVFGLSSDARISKKVAPVLVAIDDDHVYHVMHIRDPWDPRGVGWKPFIKSYGFGDLSATVYVGGRHGKTLLWPRVAPGGETQIRLDIRNNSGVTLTNLAITPTAPAGITVTARPTVETEAIEPIFFDFPFLHQENVPDGWRTAYYYDVAVSDTFTDTGNVHPVTFEASAEGLTDTFQIPAAELGVGQPNQTIQTVWGQAIDLQLEDVLPGWATPEEARLANWSEKDNLENELGVGDMDSAEALFDNLRAVPFFTSPVEAGSLVSFNLPVSDTYDASQMPWLDDGERERNMYVILKSHAEIERSGTSVINYGPVISFTDSFSQAYSWEGNQQTVEAHGARLFVTYTVDTITDTVAGQVVTQAVRGRLNEAAVTVDVFNQGDYVAKNSRITVTFPSGVDLTASSWTTAAQGADWVAFALPDTVPGERRAIQLTLQFVPTDNGPWAAARSGQRVTGPMQPSWPMSPPDTYHIIANTEGRYEHDFSVLAQEAPRIIVVQKQLAGPLEIDAQDPPPVPVGGYSIYQRPGALAGGALSAIPPYLPAVLRSSSD